MSGSVTSPLATFRAVLFRASTLWRPFRRSGGRNTDMRRRFLFLALANFAAMAAWAVWGMATQEWNFEALGGNPRPHEIVKWCLILLSAPAYLVAVAVVAPLGLTLFPDYLALNFLWAFLT